MSPRRADQSDDEILTEAVRAVRRFGPRVTLARVAREVGLSSARLVQRFGSRDELLAAAERQADVRMREAIFAGLGDVSDPLGALVTRLGEVAERNARRLYLLSNSYLFDPGHLAARSGAREAKDRERDYLAAFALVLGRAADRGQLRPGLDLPALARAVFVTWIGAYTVWAYAPVGSLPEVVRRDLGFVLGPYRTAARGGRGRAGTRR
jgi:AcrR family transcriptional regulator